MLHIVNLLMIVRIKEELGMRNRNKIIYIKFKLKQYLLLVCG